ncbi:phosphate ABC transporter permease subunit PstC [Alicyclobacillus fastidiosus]|uniref:Phosphate transport system permease protein n=1 Tax=Alicyclobacillus fastidiosus TaxID=392011 RepID=A0ABY6ZMB4_9BACL|nr:phosphate ABC transporter permease subunit PstC [Alicyclobacillus fastidiosus]WAH43989.1 phosphate ABC transporter permease subunit PstC [Alicyclobacillus fastidiosus]GMA60263.1 phosphate transport system permease protein PstC 1 [Alicyclobacillus fastidiosus]
MRRVSNASKAADRVFQLATGICASSPVLFLLAIAIIVVVQSMPTVHYMGWQFLSTIKWDMGNLYGAMIHKHGVSVPAGASYGALVFIVGTVASSLLALVIAIPVSILTAMILAYRVRGPIGFVLSVLVELLAGIPSVVIGLWGILVLAPWIAHHFGPFLKGIFGFIPFFGGDIGSGYGLLTSGIVLAIMIIPIITATTRDLFRQVPLLAREGGLGLGMTTWETVRYICLPYIKDGLVGAVALGWGRAMGETMAVLMVSGNAINILPHNLYSPISTMAAFIANQLDSAQTDASGMAVHALSEMAMVLLAITVFTNLLARFLVNRRAGRRSVKVGANG